MKNSLKILLVDDESDLIEFLTYNLESAGFSVVSAQNGEEALKKLTAKPDLIILDVMMPGIDGFELCGKIRENPDFENVPVIFLTARTSENDELHGLDLGAVDYIKKPISPRLLVARVKANLRFDSSDKNAEEKEEISLGPLVINKTDFSVKIEGNSKFFPKKEFEILFMLSSSAGKVFSRQNILDNVWGTDIYVVDRTVDVHIRKIREKLGEFGSLIETIKGVGYRFKKI